MEAEEDAIDTLPRLGAQWGVTGKREEGRGGGCRQKVLGFVGLGRGDDGNPHNDAQGSSRDDIFETMMGFFHKGQSGEAHDGTHHSSSANGINVVSGIIEEGVVPITIILRVDCRGSQESRENSQKEYKSFHLYSSWYTKGRWGARGGVNDD